MTSLFPPHLPTKPLCQRKFFRDKFLCQTGKSLTAQPSACKEGTGGESMGLVCGRPVGRGQDAAALEGPPHQANTRYSLLRVCLWQELLPQNIEYAECRVLTDRHNAGSMHLWASPECSMEYVAVQRTPVHYCWSWSAVTRSEMLCKLVSFSLLSMSFCETSFGRLFRSIAAFRRYII